MTYCRAKNAYGGTCGSPENYYGGLCAEHRIYALEDRAEKAEAKIERLTLSLLATEDMLLSPNRAEWAKAVAKEKKGRGGRENGPSLPKEATPETDDEAADRIMREGEPSGVSPSPLCEHVFSRYGVPSDYCSICGAKAAAERPAEADPHWLCWDEPCSECEEEEAAAAKAAARHYADCICTECEAARKEG